MWVYFIDDEPKYFESLKNTNIQDVWGIGKKLSHSLTKIGIFNAYQFIQHPYQGYSSILNIHGIKIWHELNGEPTINLESDDFIKKQICSSRSFANPLENLCDLESAISLFSENICRKLHQQRCSALSIMVFLEPHKSTEFIPSNKYSMHYKFEEPNCDVVSFTNVALKILRTLFVVGNKYKKAGIIIPELINNKYVQNNLFSSHSIRKKLSKLNFAISSINNNPSLKGNLVQLASSISSQKLNKTEYLSPLYSTKFEDVITINCKN